jgi:beta-phosphoglucomutase-like phosphatase (HAD superfamily)
VPDLPDGITTCLFDLDGVLTQTAKVHANAWKQMFDEFLRGWYERAGEPYREFGLGLRKSNLVLKLIRDEGVDRTGHAKALREHGADIVVQALTELLQPA